MSLNHLLKKNEIVLFYSSLKTLYDLHQDLLWAGS